MECQCWVFFREVTDPLSLSDALVLYETLLRDLPCRTLKMRKQSQLKRNTHGSGDESSKTVDESKTAIVQDKDGKRRSIYQSCNRRSFIGNCSMLQKGALT
jgi:hypothetical protein